MQKHSTIKTIPRTTVSGPFTCRSPLSSVVSSAASGSALTSQASQPSATCLYPSAQTAHSIPVYPVAQFNMPNVLLILLPVGVPVGVPVGEPNRLANRPCNQPCPLSRPFSATSERLPSLLEGKIPAGHALGAAFNIHMIHRSAHRRMHQTMVSKRFFEAITSVCYLRRKALRLGFKG